MKINITKREEGFVEFDFSGEGHTLLNLLQSSLIEDKNVEMAGYSKPHPLMDRSRLFLKLKKGDDVLEVVKKASENADGKLDEFLGEFEKSLSEF
ncbi:DNA-directed RNA polymerase subunit L [Candidatus Bathyarchaeota archaeon]|nr:MAG: DNA-directed RNA polymerase subunit L [Candidatus Bathyarchaeota archaeon]HHL41429.1 DNA-directed RNA polymerase subunit L [Candidatus Bathyarchaeota archaeon]